MMQKLSNCANSWFLKLVVKDDDSKILHRLAYNLQVKKIVSLVQYDIDLVTISEDNLALTNLELDKVHITYDSIKIRLTDIEKA